MAAPPGSAYEMLREVLGDDGIKNQEDLNAFKTWLLELDGAEAQGFYESAVEIPTRTMTLLWKGQSPLQQQAVAEGARRQLRVVIQPVSYTRTQVDRAAKALTAPSGKAALGNFEVSSLTGPSPTVDHISVAGSYRGAKGGAARAAVVGDAARLSAIASKIGEVKAVVRYGERIVPFVTRGTDYSPFNPGGMMKGANGSGCTSGFGIQLNGLQRTTTARHCSSTPYKAWDSGSTYGTTVRIDNQTAARVLGGSGGNRMFDGAWNNANGYYKFVKGLADVSFGSYVCSSGANSGVHCNLKVEEMNDQYSDPAGSYWTIRVKQQTAGQIAGAQGDSGGPIFIPIYGGTHVYAVGMLQGSEMPKTTSCGPLRITQTANGPTQCSQWIQFTSTRVLLSNIGAILRTG